MKFHNQNIYNIWLTIIPSIFFITQYWNKFSYNIT